MKHHLQPLWFQRHGIIPVIALLGGVAVLYAYTLPLGASLYSLHAGVLTIQDFTFNFNMVVAFWLRGASGLYTREDIMQALHGLLGDVPPAVMPNPTSPTAILIWLPLVLVAGKSMLQAYVIWMAMSLVLLGLLVSSSLPRGLLGSRPAVEMCFGVFLCLISNVAQTCAMLGQSSLFAAGVLGLLALRLARREACESSNILLASLLFLSSLKLPYFVIALGLLTVERRWKAISFCGLFFVVCFLIGAVWSSPQWMSGYCDTIARYALGRFSEGGFYWGGFQSETLTWARFSRDLVSPGVSIPATWCGRAVGIVWLTTLLALGPRISPPQRVYLSLRILLGTYLIFSSYLGYYEQLLLVLCPLIAVGTGQSRGWRALASFLLVYVALSDQVFPPLVSFVCKVLVLVI